jgi:hypothetical protein
MQAAILWPLVAQVALIAVVAGMMYRARIGEIRSRELDPQSLESSRLAAATLENVAAADNFRNLFEVPVLFFAVCLALAVTELVTPAQVALAWLFVALRAAHTAIHLSYNRVMHRFVVYAAGLFCVLVMWALFALSLWREA